MAYSRVWPEGWKDNEAGGTYIDAAGLNKMEQGIIDAHDFMARTDNPHNVTKAQVGLGNVPNVETNDQTPTYTAASTLSGLSSGEKISTAFGKLARAITNLISHLADTTIHITAAERTNWNSKTSNTGTVTKVSTGAGLTGGDITGSGTVKMNLLSETKLSNAAAAAKETAGRVYPVALDKNGKASVNVPWTDTNINTTYTITQDVTDKHKFTLTGSDGSSVTITIPDNDTKYTLSSLGIGNVKNYDQSKAIKSISRSGTTFTYTCLDNTTGTFTQQDNDTWTALVGATSSKNGTAGYVPAPPSDGYNAKYLRADGTWTVPPDTNTTYSEATQSASGLMSASDKKKLDGVATGATANGAYTSNPAMNGTASPGSNANFARGDHVHPVDTSRAPKSHATTATTYGTGNASNYGHLKLSDSYSSTSGTGSGIAATPSAVKAAYDRATGAYPANNAGAHNSIYRGKYLGNAVTAAQYASIDAGTFDDIYIGDYWTINGINWRVAELDRYLHYGDTECTKHHVIVVPDTSLTTAQMNKENVVTGAYVGSDYYTGANGNTAREDVGNIIKAAFGSAHILAHRIVLQNYVPEGKGYTGVWGGWYDAHPADLMSEEMVYGCKQFKNEMSGENLAGNYTIDFGQLPLFRLDHSSICIRFGWWLLEVGAPWGFSNVDWNGNSACGGASLLFGVRPASAICA